MTKNIFIISLIFIASCNAVLKFPKIFQDGMVLQAGPTQANVWGFLEGNVLYDVKLEVECTDNHKETLTFVPNVDANMFEFRFLVQNGAVCHIKIEQPRETLDGFVTDVLELNDVLFGDVWVCSGQSNMEWNMGNIINSTEELEKTEEYPNIRMIKLAHLKAETPQDDIMDPDNPQWFPTSPVGAARGFSAVCLLTARYFADVLGKDKVFGLIESNWGGTRIETWMTAEGLENCEIAQQSDFGQLYNAMIHPLIRLSIYGGLWYQGEANTGGIQELERYGCSFKNLIGEWRRVWSENTNTNSNFPFGFVQLAQVRENQGGIGYQMIRWYQTDGYGYVPNDSLENVFMAVSLDTFDSQTGIHPRNKQLPCKRLSTAGLNVAYGLKDYPTNGPFPVDIKVEPLPDPNGRLYVEITYDQPFTWNPTETEGFYVCTKSDLTNFCINGWQKLPSGMVLETTETYLKFEVVGETAFAASAIAYLWETTPVLGTEALPIYASDEYRLPGAPWWYRLYE